MRRGVIDQHHIKTRHGPDIYLTVVRFKKVLELGAMDHIEFIKIEKSETPYFEPLVDAFTQQMNDIGSNRSRLDVELAIKNALKPGSRALIFLAMDNDAIVGTVLLNICSGIESGGDYIWINEIQILPNQRRKGYGRKLLRHVLEWSRLNNIKTVLGIADVKNKASFGLFRSENFNINNMKWMSRDL